MPAPRKKKVAEPATNESLADNIQENATTADVEVDVAVDVAVETVSASLELALDNIYATTEGAKTAINEQAAAVQEQVAAAKEQVTEQVAAAKEQVTEQVAAAKEQVAAAKEQVTAQVAAAKEQVTEQVAAVKEQVAGQVAAVTQQINGAKDAIVEMATKSLAETVMSALKPGKDLKIVISKSASNMITAIASSSPAVLDDIKKSLLEVIKDNKIDSSDIPHLIAIIQSLYEIVCNLKEFHLDNQSRASICAEVLKFISHFLILDDHLCVDKLDQMMFLNQIDTLIDSCASLLSFSSAIKVDGSCLFPFFCK
jgi:hypothetical protein